MQDTEASSEQDHSKVNPFDDPEEAAHFKTVVSAFFNYAVNTITLINLYVGRCNERHSEDGKGFR